MRAGKPPAEQPKFYDTIMIVIILLLLLPLSLGAAAELQLHRVQFGIISAAPNITTTTKTRTGRTTTADNGDSFRSLPLRQSRWSSSLSRLNTWPTKQFVGSARWIRLHICHWDLLLLLFAQHSVETRVQIRTGGWFKLRSDELIRSWRLKVPV